MLYCNTATVAATRCWAWAQVGVGLGARAAGRAGRAGRRWGAQSERALADVQGRAERRRVGGSARGRRRRGHAGR